MPTYEYQCTKCGHTFEAFQPITARPLARCPKCGGSVKRLINGGMGVIFKGSGFYSTDNKKGSALTGGNGATKEKGKPSDGTSSESKSSDKPKEMAGEKTKEK